MPSRPHLLPLGKIPFVVGTLTTRAGLEAFVTAHRDACDIAEVRLDEIGVFPGWMEACRKIEAAGRPVMLTLRSTKDGGRCGRSREERRALLTQAAACASIVDVEHNSDSPAELKPVIAAAGKLLLVSYHDFARTPPQRDLEQVIAEASPHAAAVKIATMVQTDADLATLDAVLREPRKIPLCLIGMGAKGTRTRTDYPALGSCLTYGYLDAVSAPGQLSARELVAHLLKTHPAYAAAHSRRSNL
ncbi:MAG: type I 3-dehydroquinate dehydratase [Opitutae bacterium]|nr:type I 3-dehydroquinate dehydratase [Opitutae bacterium]